MFSKSTIKYIQSLQHKKFRDEYNVFVAEGPKVVSELMESGIFNCKSIFADESWVTANTKLLASWQDRIEIVKSFELEKIAHYSTANKVVAIFEKKEMPANIPFENRITLVMDEIQDPGNLGTIIRTAHWFGIEYIVCSPNCADMYNSKVVQSTMASLGRVEVIYLDLDPCLKQAAGIPKFAATLHGKPLTKFKGLKEAILIIGNESKGISKDILGFADEEIKIPGYGSAESLNAAVATGILLYAMRLG